MGKRKEKYSRYKRMTFFSSVSAGTMEQMTEQDMRTVANGWSWAIFTGIVMILAGAVAIIYPLATTSGFVFLIGLVLVTASVVQVVHSFSARGWEGLIWNIFGAIVCLAAGLFLLLYPFGTIITMTLVLGVYLVASGLVKFAKGLFFRTASWGVDYYGRSNLCATWNSCSCGLAAKFAMVYRACCRS